MELSSRKRVLLLIESSRAFGQLLVKGIVSYSKYHTHWRFYREASGLNERKADIIKWSADGIIAHVTDTRIAKTILPPGIPAVVKGINEIIPGVCNITGDTKLIAQMAAEHLSGRLCFDRSELDRVLSDGDQKRGRGRPRRR